MRVEIVAYGLSVHSGDFLFPRSKEPSGHVCMSYGDAARVAEHPVDVRIATTEAERRIFSRKFFLSFPKSRQFIP